MQCPVAVLQSSLEKGSADVPIWRINWVLMAPVVHLAVDRRRCALCWQAIFVWHRARIERLFNRGPHLSNVGIRRELNRNRKAAF